MGAMEFDFGEIERLLKSADSPIGKELEQRTARVMAAAIRLCPVDTGRLRSSISMEMSEDEEGMFGRVGTDVDYATYVEFGTSKMAGIPFLRPALEYAGSPDTAPRDANARTRAAVKSRNAERARGPRLQGGPAAAVALGNALRGLGVR